MKHSSLRAALHLFSWTAIIFLLFGLKMQFDNKYTVSEPQPTEGLLALTPELLEAYPIIHLRDDWAFFQYQFLTPKDLSSGLFAPTTYLYLGQYGGFELDTPSASPYGVASYYLNIDVDATFRSYTLEIPQIYSDYCIWINGELMRNRGIPSIPKCKNTPETSIAFSASEQIEILISVYNDSGIYSGLVYPPAFGLSAPVSRLINTREALSAAFSAIALATAFVYLFIGYFTRPNISAILFAFLCLCCAFTIGRLLLRTFGLDGELITLLIRCSQYGAITLILFLQGRLIGLPPLWRWLIASTGIAFCTWATIFPLIYTAPPLSTLLFFSQTLTVYKWLVCIALVLCGIFALRRGLSQHHLVGGIVFICALFLDRLVPLYEPVLLLWPIESAILINVGILLGNIISDTVRIFKEHLVAREREKSLLQVLEVRELQYSQLTGHLDAIRKLKHEMRGFLLQLNFYLQQRDYQALRLRLDEEIGSLCPSSQYTGHSLFDTILTHYSSLCNERGTSLQINVSRLSPSLKIADNDLVCLLSNIFQNALDATAFVSDPAKRTILFSAHPSGNYLKIVCANTALSAPVQNKGEYITSKPQSNEHGFGLAFIQDIVRKYGGDISVSYSDAQFTVRISLLI